MPTIDFGQAIHDGIDLVNYTVASPDWDTFTFGPTVESVRLRSRAGDLYVSRVATGVYNAATADHITVPSGESLTLDLLDQRSAAGPRVGSLQIAHSSPTGVVEFELRRGGR